MFHVWIPWVYGPSKKGFAWFLDKGLSWTKRAFYCHRNWLVSFLLCVNCPTKWCMIAVEAVVCSPRNTPTSKQNGTLHTCKKHVWVICGKWIWMWLKKSPTMGFPNVRGQPWRITLNARKVQLRWWWLPSSCILSWPNTFPWIETINFMEPAIKQGMQLEEQGTSYREQ